MEKTLEIRHMDWDKYEKYMDEIEPKRPAFDDKGNVVGTKTKAEAILLLDKFQRIAAKWVMDNIYPDFEIKLFTPMEIIGIYSATMRCTNAVRVDEIKNLKSSLIGSVKEPITAEAARKKTSKQVKS